MNNNLADTSKLAESFFITRNGLSPNDKPFYHISDCLQPLISGILDRHGNAGDDSNVHQKTTASNDRRGFTFCN